MQEEEKGGVLNKRGDGAVAFATMPILRHLRSLLWLLVLMVPTQPSDDGAAAAESNLDEQLDPSAKEHLRDAKGKSMHAQYETHVRRLRTCGGSSGSCLGECPTSSALPAWRMLPHDQ